MRIESLPPEAIPADTSAFWTALTEKLGPETLNERFYRSNATRRRIKTMFHLVSQCAPLTTCLEIGCAAGLVTGELATAFEWVVAVDNCQTLIDAAPDLDNVTYRYADADAMDDVIASVLRLPGLRVAFLSEVLEHVRDPQALVTNCAGVSDYIIASSPIGEQLTAKAFDLAAYDETPEHPEDGSGHIWAWDLEGFASLFDGLEILRIGTVARFGIVLVKCGGASA